LLFDDLLADVEKYHIEEWEDPTFAVDVLLTLLRSCQKLQGEKSDRPKYFQMVYRLDPLRAMEL
jgi:hypothetical protein